MTTALAQSPGFQQAQKVTFIGGNGVVKSCKYEAGTWSYVVEMSLGTKPSFGRIGAETMVLFNEADLHAA